MQCVTVKSYEHKTTQQLHKKYEYCAIFKNSREAR